MPSDISVRHLVDEDAERAVISAMLIDRASSLLLIDTLRPEDFFLRKYALIFESMAAVMARHQHLDEIVLSNELRLRNHYDQVGGEEEINDLAQSLASIAQSETYAQIVRDNSLARQVSAALKEGISSLHQSTQPITERVDAIEKLLLQVTTKRQKAAIITAREGVQAVVRRIEKMRAQGTSIAGIPTQIASFDRMIGGWRPGTFNVIAGRPGMGKTAFALQCAQRAAVDFQLPVAIFTFEMKFEPLFSRMLSNEKRVDGKRMQSGQLTISDYDRLTLGCSIIQEAPIYVIESYAMMAGDVAAMARRLVAEKNIKLFVVDYIQKIATPSFQTQEREVAYTVERLSRMASELDVPVLALSQLNRGAEQQGDKRPEASNLLASGRIEADADTITILYRSDYYAKDDERQAERDNVLELMVKKNRSGEAGTAKAVWDGAHCRIENIAYNP